MQSPYIILGLVPTRLRNLFVSSDILLEFLALPNLVKNKNIVIQKPDKGNSVVTFNKTDYLDKMENLLNDKCKFEKNGLKNDGRMTEF